MSENESEKLRMVADEMEIVDPHSGKSKMRINDQNQVLPPAHQFVQDASVPDICSICGRTYSQCFKENKNEQSHE